MIGGHEDCVQILLQNHYDAWQLADFLSTEGAWHEFVPHDNDTYIVAVQPHMADVAVSRCNQWNIPVERKS